MDRKLLHLLKSSEIPEKDSLIVELQRAIKNPGRIAEDTLSRLQEALESKQEKLIGRAVVSVRKALIGAVKEKGAEGGKDSEGASLPRPPDLTTAHIRAFEKVVGLTIVEMIMGDKTFWDFAVGKTKFQDCPYNFFRRVALAVLGSRSSFAEARVYLNAIKAGETHEKAKKKALSVPKGLPNPPTLTQIQVQAFEDAIGEKLENVSTRDEKKHTFSVDGANYQESINAFLQRVAKHAFGKHTELGKGRLYLIGIRDGLDHATAKARVESPEIAGAEKLPNPPNLTAPLAIAFQKALGHGIQSARAEDDEERIFSYKRTNYKDSPKSLFIRASYTIFKKVNLSAGRRYVTLIRDGLTHDAAEAQVKAEVMNKEETLPDPPTLNAGHLRAFEDAVDITLEDMSSNDKEQRTFTYAKKNYHESPRALLGRIGYALFGSRSAYSLSRLYLIKIREGKADAEAKTETETFFVESPDKLPNPPALTAEHIKTLEDVVGVKVNAMKVDDNERCSFKLGAANFLDSPQGLFIRTSNALFDEITKLAKARDYCVFIREGSTHAQALTAVKLGEELGEMSEFEGLSKLKMEEAIALFQNDPLKLKFYMQFAHPEMAEAEIDRLIIRSFKGLVVGPNRTKEAEYLRWDEDLPDVSMKTKMLKATKEKSLIISGKAPKAECIYVSGCWNRRVRIEQDGTFTVNIPLKIGKQNEVRVMGLDRENKVRSAQQEFVIAQEGETDDVAAIIELLSILHADLLAGIQRDPGRMKFFVACAEKILIKKFGRSFEEGKVYVQQLIGNAGSDIIRKVLAGVLKNFEAINKMRFLNVKEGSLMFFQKYCAYAVRRKMAEGAAGVILANDPGLGKTRTVLAALSDEEAAIFTPNSVVSAWDEEANEVLEDPDLLVMRDIPHETRKQLIRNGEHLRLVTNVQFLRKTKDAERFVLLSNDNTVVVHDEAHSRANEQSEQSRGARMLKHKFQINISATPFKNPKTLRRILSILEPGDPRFQSDVAFEQEFPARDSEALKALSLLKDKYTIRFRKQDVMEEVDPSILLSQQVHKLPRKEYILPDTLGQFEMSEDQAEAIYELFLNWPEWCRRYDKYMPDDQVAEEDHLRSAGSLTKRHALRQTVNNPEYVGSSAEDAKAWQVQRIVRKCLKKDRKVVIFCGYNAQTLKYAEMFKEHNPALYIGLTSQQGEKKDDQDQPRKFAREKAGKKSKRGWIFDANGYPKGDKDGEPMSALDYERLTFQNAPDRKIIIATYQAGAVGTTFTAGKAMIFDDLPADVVESIQAEDRIHRIDPHRQTHASVQYYTMQSHYPKRFLERMKKRWVVKQEDGTYVEYKSCAAAQSAAETLETEAQTAYDAFFAQGTYDQVQFQNLQTQKQMFHLINDGIADESVLKEAGDGLSVID